MFTYLPEVNAHGTTAAQTSPTLPSGRADHISSLLLRAYKQRLQQDKPVLPLLSRMEWPHRCHSPVSGHRLKDVQRLITKCSQDLEKKTFIKSKVYFNLVEYDLLPTGVTDLTPPSAPVEQASGARNWQHHLLPVEPKNWCPSWLPAACLSRVDTTGLLPTIFGEANWCSPPLIGHHFV